MATHCHHPLRPNCWRRRPSLWAPSQRSVAGRSVALEVHLAVRALQAAVETLAVLAVLLEESLAAAESKVAFAEGVETLAGREA